MTTQTMTSTKDGEPEFVEVDQRTDEWLQWRGSLITASYASVIMGQPPKWGPQTWSDLRHDLEFGSDEEVNDAMQYGIDNERQALAMMNDEMDDLKYHPACFENTVGGVKIGASYDGVRINGFDDTLSWVEIKCPYNGIDSTLYNCVERSVRTGIIDIPKYVYWQMLHQALVLGDRAGDGILCVYGGPGYGIVFLQLFDLQDDRTPQSVYNDIDRLKEEVIAFGSGADQYENFSRDSEFRQLELKYAYARQEKIYFTQQERALKEKLMEYVKSNTKTGRHSNGFHGDDILFKKGRTRRMNASKMQSKLGEKAIEEMKSTVDYWSISDVK